MPGYTYILRCADDSFYTGSTTNIEKRLLQHCMGEAANYTKVRLPVHLIYLEEYYSVADAFKREKQIQGWTKAKKQALIKENYQKLHELAQCQNISHYMYQYSDK